MEQSSFLSFVGDHLAQFLSYTAFANFTIGHGIMMVIGLIFIYLAIAREYEPLLLVPIGFGILIGNIPFFPGLKVGIYESGSVLKNHLLMHAMGPNVAGVIGSAVAAGIMLGLLY